MALEKELNNALNGNDVELTKSLIQQGANIDFVRFRSTIKRSKVKEYFDAIELALINKSANHLDVLINAGAKISLTDEYGHSTIGSVIENPIFNIDQLKNYVSHMVIPNSDYFKTFYAINPLFTALKQKHITPEHIEYLIGLGIPLTCKHSDVLLTIASEHHNVGILKCCFKYDTAIETLGDFGRPPLFSAIRAKQYDNMRFLIDNGAKLDYFYGGHQYHAIHLAGGRNISKAIEVLLKNDSDINTVNSEGKTSLMFACDSHAESAAKYLIERGADIYLRDNNGWTALHYAATVNNPVIIKLLIDLGLDINKKDNSGVTPLMIAVEKVKPKNVALFIELGADVNVVDNNGRTALLHHTCKYEEGIIKALLNAGSYIDHQDNEGNTIILKEVNKKNFESVNLLIEREADVLLINNKGQSISDIFARKKSVEPGFNALVELIKLKAIIDDCEDMAPGL